MREKPSEANGSRASGRWALDWRNPLNWLILGGFMLIASIVVGTATVVLDFRERALGNSGRELENTALLLARHFDREFGDFEAVQRSLALRIASMGVTSSAEFKRLVSTGEFHAVLEPVAGSLTDVAGVNVFDDNGQLINSSRFWPVPDLNIADRSYYRDFVTNDHSPLVLLTPVRSHLTGLWTIVVARKIVGPDGQFLGVVTRGVSPTNLESFFESITLGTGSAISLSHRDATLLARYPHVEDMIGRNFRTTAIQQLLSTKNHGTLRWISPVDGQDRLTSARALSDFPLSIITTITVATALADWREQTQSLIIAAGLATVVIAFTLFVIARKLLQQHRESQQRLALEKERLDTAVNNMTQGLLLYDKDARIILCNQRYLDMYNLSADVVKPGLHFRDLIMHRKEIGSFLGDPDAFCS